MRYTRDFLIMLTLVILLLTGCSGLANGGDSTQTPEIIIETVDYISQTPDDPTQTPEIIIETVVYSGFTPEELLSFDAVMDGYSQENMDYSVDYTGDGGIYNYLKFADPEITWIDDTTLEINSSTTRACYDGASDNVGWRLENNTLKIRFIIGLDNESQILMGPLCGYDLIVRISNLTKHDYKIDLSFFEAYKP